MDWQRLDDKRASRVAVTVSKQIGLKDEDRWDKLQNDLIDAMIKFENAFRERIRKEIALKNAFE